MPIQAAPLSALNPGRVFASGQWEIDLGQRELRTGGVPVPIGNRAFEIISVLVQSAGKLVSKDDLMGRCIPGIRHLRRAGVVRRVQGPAAPPDQCR